MVGHCDPDSLLSHYGDDAETFPITVVGRVVTLVPGRSTQMDRGVEPVSSPNHVDVVVSVFNPNAAV